MLFIGTLKVNGGARETGSVVTGATVSEGLRALGLNGDSIVIVHASLSSFGEVEGGAAAVAKALTGIAGTVVVHAGTWDLTGLPCPPGIDRPDNAAERAASWAEFDAAMQAAAPYSLDLPIDRSLGAIPEALRTGFDHVRGPHPLRSLLAIGQHASEIIARQRLDSLLGPIEAVAELDGDVLLLGVDHRTNTAIHLAEQQLGRSCFYRHAKLQQGVWAELPNVPGSGCRFDDIEPWIRGKTSEAQIGNCRARLVKVRCVLEAATELILSDPGALLCDDANCRCAASLRQREKLLATKSTL